jgi:hypothetical protein
MAILYSLLSFWYFSRFGLLQHEKSGNPDQCDPLCQNISLRKSSCQCEPICRYFFAKKLISSLHKYKHCSMNNWCAVAMFFTTNDCKKSTKNEEFFDCHQEKRNGLWKPIFQSFFRWKGKLSGNFFPQKISIFVRELHTLANNSALIKSSTNVHTRTKSPSHKRSPRLLSQS